MHQLQQQHNLQQQMAVGNLHQSQQQMQVSQQQANSDIPAKRQAVVDRLKRRFEIYRRRQNEVAPRFEQTFDQTCEQQSMETNLLQKRFLESKAKRVPKKTEKKQTDSIAGSLQNSVHVQQNFLKRPADESSENLTKFSVEIVQQLEFTTSAADSGQPQQISTNVTVKALTNASVKSDNSGHPSPATPQSQPQTAQHSTNNDLNSNHMASPSPHLQQNDDLDLVGNIVDFKQEPENDFADLKLSDLIGDNTNDESDTFKELISDLSDFHPDSMNLLNFDEKPMLEVKQEHIQSDLQSNHQMQHHQMPLDTMGTKTNIGSPLHQQQYTNNYACQQDNLSKRLPSFNQHNGPTGSVNELSPAAQTLKQMAEQHQHKTAMNNGMVYQRTNLQPNNGSSFTGFNNQFSRNEFNIGQQQPASFNKSDFPVPDFIKQEMIFPQQNEYDFKRLQQMQQKPLGVNPNGVQNNFTNKASQQYVQYPQQGSNSLPNHGPQANNFMPNNGNANNRNTSGSNNNMGHTTLQMKQTQQMHINQHGKPESLSMTQQQGVYFNQQPSHQHSESYSMSQSQTINFTQQTMRQSQQSSSNQTNSSNRPGFGVGRAGPQANETSNINVDLNNSNTNKSNNFRNSDTNTQQQQAPLSSTAAQMTGLNVPSNQQNAAQNLTENNHSLSGNVQLNINQSQHIMGVHQLGQTHPQSNMMNIHANQMPVNSNNNSMPIRSQEQMKVLQHQQQMMRLQQQQQQQYSLGTMGSRAANSQIHPQQQALQAQTINQAGRFANPASMRQLSHKPMPPSGPMIRQQQHALYMQNNMGPRAMGYGQNNINTLQTPNVQVQGQPVHQQEWRQMVMSQQQNINYNSNFNSDGFGQMQQQLMRSQHQTSVNQNQMQQHQMNTIHMSQTQNIVNTFQTNQQSANTNQSNEGASVMQNNDFSLEFLDLPDGAQDLLNSLENETFNIQDML